MARLADEVGLAFDPPDHIPRTRQALEAGEWVRRNQPDRFSGFHRALFAAYWADRRDIGSRKVVLALAESSGVTATGVEQALGERAMSDHVNHSTSTAVRIGVDGTPAWLIDRRLLVPGAQPREAFDRLVERLQEGPGGPPAGWQDERR